MKPVVAFTRQEANAIYDLIDSLSGGNPENGFANDGTDDPENAYTRALAKLFLATGHKVPKTCEKVRNGLS